MSHTGAEAMIYLLVLSKAKERYKLGQGVYDSCRCQHEGETLT